MKKILVAEDESNLRRLVANYLKKEGFIIVEASNGLEALEKFSQDRFALVILDIMMPFKDGLQVCREIRQQSDVPVVMLTARSQEYDELSGFSCGADEYITKPFSPAILITRIKAVLKRVNGAEEDKTEYAGITLYRREHRAEAEGRPVLLTPREYELLACFMSNRSIALTREQLIEHVWGYDYEGDDRTVDTHIKCLRAKLGTCGECIRTTRKHGYMLNEQDI
ncbi:MAG: response regulator transcription factor [Saccharofermentanales bacterium]